MTPETAIWHSAAAFPLGEPAKPDSRQAREAEFVRRLRAGDDGLSRDLVEQNQGRIFRLVNRIVPNPGDAEEIAQEAFAKVYLSIGAFAGRSTLAPWIYGIVINEACGFLRKRRRNTSVEIARDAPDLPGNIVADGRPGPERDSAAREYLHALLAGIPRHARFLLLLREFEDPSLAEAAEVSGLSGNTLKSRRHRARKRVLRIADVMSVNSKGAR